MVLAPMTRSGSGVHDRRMVTARRSTGRGRGIAVLVVVGFALWLAVVPAGYRVVAEEPPTDTAPTTVPETPPSEPTTEPTVTTEPTTEPAVTTEPTTEPTVTTEPTTEPTDTTEPTAEPAPANDDWANAEDLSTLSIPAFVGVPRANTGEQVPRDTAKVPGSIEFATYEPGEYDPGLPGGSVWYKYTSPPGGFAGRLGILTRSGFQISVWTENASPGDAPPPWADAWGPNLYPALGNSWGPSGLYFVRMEPGHTVWISVYNRVSYIDPGPFTLELFQAPNEQDSIANAYSGTGAGEYALSTDFGLYGDGDTYHLTPDLGGAPNGWYTLRFDVPGTLRVIYQSATAKTLSWSMTNEGSLRPVELRIYRSPQATRIADASVLTEVAVGTPNMVIHNRITGARSTTIASVTVTPGRYYWTAEEGEAGPTFFISDVDFTASSGTDNEPPSAAISTPPDGARYTVDAVPSSVVATCTDSQGPATSLVTVDGVETTSLVTSPGSHSVSLECTDSAGNMRSVSSAYTVTSPPTGPCVIIDTPSVDFGEVAIGSTSATQPVVVRSCSDAPIGLAVSVSNATGVTGAQTWRAGTSTVPSANEFIWSITPPGSPSPTPVGPTLTTVGPPLAARASRTDDHRITLGPTGPGLGIRFTSTVTYTAINP